MLRTTLCICTLAATLLLCWAVLPETSASATLDQEDLAAIERLVDKGVAKRLAPVQRNLALLSDQGIGPTEIAGGIGYIVGIGGLLAWGASRRKKP